MPSAVQAAAATNDAASTNEDTPVTINVLGNDTPLGGLKLASVTVPGNGTAVILDESAGTILYTPASNWNGTDTFTYSVSEGSTLFYAGTGHYYEFVQDAGRTWSAARDAAALRTLYGLHGYLVTITSPGEQDFVRTKLVGEGWMGASDETEEHIWKWVTGPAAEQTQFCVQTGGVDKTQYDYPSSTGGYTLTPGQCAYWATEEPNNWGTGEDYAHFRADGTWNDYAGDNTSTAGYVVEYGGMSGDAPIIPTATVTVTVNAVNDAPVMTGGDSTSITMSEDGSPTAFSLTLNATDVNADTLTWSISTAASHGTATASGTGLSKVIGYAPVANYNGSDSFIVQVTDGALTDTTTVNVTVNPRNDAPVNTALPTVSGTPTVGATLTATPGSWNDSLDMVPGTLSYLYVWQRADSASGTRCVAITGANFATYVVGTGSAHKYVRVQVGCTDNGEGFPVSQSAFAYSVWTIQVVNRLPVITEGASVSVTMDEDGSPLAWSLALNATDADGDTLTWSISTAATHGTATASGTGSSKAIGYTPTADHNGPDSFVVQVSDAYGGTDTITVNVTVTPVNDMPSFTKGADQTVLEDCGGQTVNPWATAISAGPANESPQALTFTVTGNTNTALFSVLPAVSSTGTLTYTPAPDANGEADVTLTLTDDATRGGAALTTAPQTFKITVTPVNDMPSFTKGADQTVLEDCGGQTVNPWATAISAGPVDEAGQVLHFDATNNNNTLFSTQPIVTPLGTLAYTPAANMNGSAIVTLHTHDDGGVSNGGVDTSADQTFTITITPVNDVPSFMKGADQTVLEDCGLQTVAGWATSISAGPADESRQALNFIVTNDNTTLFSTQPAVAANGTLTYTLALNRNGSATVTICIHDDGGMANAGVDTSTPQTFTITVNPHNDPPVDTYTLTYAADANGTISGTSPQTVNQGASGTAVTATPDAGYHFVSWSDGSLTAARTDTNVTVNINVSASFAININIHRYALTANVSGSGSVAKSPDQSSYTHGISVQLTATPATGWHFVGWSGDLSGTTNPATITMDVSKTVTATYAPLPHPVSRHTIVLTIDIKTMTVDGARITLDAPAALLEDRTLVPLRALVEHLGGTISWNAKTRQVILKTRGATMILTIGKSTALVNGKLLAIDPKNSKVVPILSSGRTMLPLRFVAENLGLQVEWGAKTRTITVNWED